MEPGKENDFIILPKLKILVWKKDKSLRLRTKMRHVAVLHAIGIGAGVVDNTRSS